MGFKDRLKKLRGDRGITQEQLATKTGIPASTIRRYESSEEVMIQKDRLQILADFFDCSIDFLLGRTEDPRTVLTDPSRAVIDSLDLDDEEIIKQIKFKVDGKALSPEQIKQFLVYVRVQRANEES